MRLIQVCLLALPLALMLCGAARANFNPSVSYTAISADGQTVYFTFDGDVWAAPRNGGEPARRLTDNVAYDGRPLPSPDGKWLAFLSDRFGNYDIFVMPIEGGEARRLTWDSGTDYLYDWKADSSAILEYCQRGRDEWGYSMWEVYLDGSQPKRLSGPDQDGHVFGCYLGADKLVYARDPGDWARKHYHGTFQHDIWMIDRATGHHTQLTTYDGKDLWPQPTPDGSKIYFVSDRDGTENIWEMTVATRKLRQITHFKGDGPRWPRISTDGDEISCEVFGDFYVVPLDGGQPQKIDIDVALSPKHEMDFDSDMNGNIDEFAVSPNGNYFAFTVLGDIYLLKNPDVYKDEDKPDQDLSRARQLTFTPNREMQITWHPKEMKIAYVSDRDGQFDVYVLDLTTMKETQLTDTPVDEWRPKFAPHGNRLAYYSGDHQLMIHDFDTDQTALFHYGLIRAFARDEGYEWSPDANWIAFGEYIRDDLTDVYIKNVETGDKYDVSHSANWSEDIRWSPDGKYLAWTEEAYYYEEPEQSDYVVLLELNPKKENYDFNVLFPDDMPKPEPAENPEAAAAEAAESEEGEAAALAKEEAKSEEGKAEETKAGEEEKVEPIVIDLEDIDKRGERVTGFPGSSWGAIFSPDSSYLIFSSDHSGENVLYSLTLEDRDVEEITSLAGKDSLAFAPDGKRVYFTSRGRLSYQGMNGPKPGGPGVVPTTSHVAYDQWDMWDQVLVEGWRYLNEYFYDENMHGVDWQAILAHYRPRVRRLGGAYEFGQLYREMLGELNSSHMNYSPAEGTGAEAPPERTGYLGVYYDEAFPGPGWKVASVVKDGPADKPGSELKPGDVITAVNGEAIAKDENRAEMMRNLVGEPVKLSVTRQGEDGGEPSAVEVPIKPTSSRAMDDLKYEEWVQHNKDMVDKLSGGKLAYQHIRQMNHESLMRFRKELFTDSIDKQGLVLDVRFNGGGSTSVAVLDLLARRGAYLRIRRGSTKGDYAREQVFEAPVVLLINAHSFSNAEILAHVLKDAGVATLVGEATGGNVISTGSVILMDGSRMAMPGYENARINGVDMEGHGAQPDVNVEIDPNALEQGRDNQIEAAVKFLLSKIEEKSE